MKSSHIAIFLLVFAGSVHGQGLRFGFTGSVGSSWVSLPRTYIADLENYLVYVYHIAPEQNVLALSGGFSGDYAFTHPLFGFRTEINLTYLGGWLSFDREDLTDTAPLQFKGRQEYLQVEIPVLFRVRTLDWFDLSGGPVAVITLQNNKVLRHLSRQVDFPGNIDQDFPFGWRFRIAASHKLVDPLEISCFWDFDFHHSKTIEAVDNTYQMPLRNQVLGFRLTYWVFDR